MRNIVVTLFQCLVFQAVDLGFQAMEFGFQGIKFGLQAMEFGLQVIQFGLQANEFIDIWIRGSPVLLALYVGGRLKSKLLSLPVRKWQRLTWNCKKKHQLL